MTDAIEAIQERHEEVTANWMHGYFDRDGVQAHADRAVLLARVAELEAAVNALPGLMAERDRMREALEPFALAAEDQSDNRDDTELCSPTLAIGSLRRARAALGEQP